MLSGLGVDYEIRTLPDVDESYPDTLRGADIPLYIAKEKANAYRNMLQSGELMITADTIVWLDGKVLGKPKDREDALCMLRDMSGRTHEVFTGVCITTTEWQRSFSAQTEVRFSKLSEEEIIYYVDKFQPMDKAGAYGVQEWIGLHSFELSKLNELNDAIKSIGGVIGINTETFDGNEDAIKEAASILESQGAKSRNLSIDSDCDARCA